MAASPSSVVSTHEEVVAPALLPALHPYSSHKLSIFIESVTVLFCFLLLLRERQGNDVAVARFDVLLAAQAHHRRVGWLVHTCLDVEAPPADDDREGDVL